MMCRISTLKSCMLSKSIKEMSSGGDRSSKQFNGSAGKHETGTRSSVATISKKVFLRKLFPIDEVVGRAFERSRDCFKSLICSEERHDKKSLISLSGRDLKIGENHE